MAMQYSVDDSNWDEVQIINGYAVFMGYLMTGVRGLGVLIVTWTTVVLLGGFVSDLGRKDFWCLTGITLVQTAGVFNFLLKEKLSDVLHFCSGLGFAIAAAVRGDTEKEPIVNAIIGFTLLVIQGLVLGIILCPVGVLYMFGLYISAGLSLWRLIEPDFGNEGGDNKKPALKVLYGLAVAQGMLFCYKTIHSLAARNRLVKFAAQNNLETVDQEVVAEYPEETVAGCEKDPSFATGRNLVTYGVGLMMEGKSNEGFIAGIRVVAGAIKDDVRRGRRVLAKHLLTSRSDFWSHGVQRLLHIVGPGSPYSREVREHAARIVSLVARAIRLQQFPRVMECISSVLEPDDPSAGQDSYFEEICRDFPNKFKDYERVELLEEDELLYLKYESKRKAMETERDNKVHGFDGLIKEAANIIQQLAVNEDNRRIMSSAVIHKFIMALLKLHTRDDDHGAILEKYWVQWLVAAIKETTSQWQVPEDGGGGRSGEEEIQEVVEELRSTMAGPALRIATSSINRTIKSIFDCFDCGATQKMHGIHILLYLSLDMSFIMDNESSTRRLTWVLLLAFGSYYNPEHWMVISAFTGWGKDIGYVLVSSIRRLAGEKLSCMLGEKHEPPSGESAIVLHLTGDITSAFEDDFEDISIRIHAAMIIEYLCSRDDGGQSLFYFFDKVEGILADTIMKVVKEILARCASTGEERQVEDPDVEKGVLEDDVLDSSMEKERFRKALVSLCQDGYMKHPTLRPKFEEIASKICEEQGKSFEDFKSLLV